MVDTLVQRIWQFIGFLAVLLIYCFQFFDVGFSLGFYFVQVWDFSVAYKGYGCSIVSHSGGSSDSMEIY